MPVWHKLYNWAYICSVKNWISLQGFQPNQTYKVLETLQVSFGNLAGLIDKK